MSEFQYRHQPVLLVDDDLQTLGNTRELLLSAGFSNVFIISDSRMALSFLKQHQIKAIVLDLLMPHISGQDLLKQLSRDYPHIPVIVVTAADDVKTAVECMKLGAFDYLIKPVNKAEFLLILEKSFQNLYESQASTVKHLQNHGLKHPEAFEDIKSCSSSMYSIFRYVEKIASSSFPVMITGESGTGKELLARAIHRLSAVDGDMVTVNVAGLDDVMFSDVLFGHRKGAFTGADQMREGLVAKAEGGTLFLDEIGDLNELSQVKLLRLLQEGEYYQAGSDTVKKSSARVLLATNVDLDSMIKKGRFRRDLYFRLCTHLVHILPLRDRKEDIPLLFANFVKAAAGYFNKPVPAVEPGLMESFSRYPFHGNVRELKSLVFDAVARSSSGILGTASFPVISQQAELPCLAAAQPPSENHFDSICSLFGRLPTFREIEDFLINEALKVSGSNHAIAAELLGVTRQTINNRLKNINHKTI